MNAPAPRRFPGRLHHGDTVALIAPAGPVAADALASGVAALETWGLRVRVLPSARSRHGTLGYLAGEDHARARDLQQAWVDPSVRAVIAARGGYGCTRLFEEIEWHALAEVPPKIFAGSSDVTALHAAIGAHLGVPTLFSPMPTGTYFDDRAAQRMRPWLFGSQDSHGTIRGEGAYPLVGGRAQGITVGGNLAMIAAGIGTPENRPAAGGIALLEDVGESPYRIDRMLTQLLRSGWFDGVAGIALGSWTGCGDDEVVRSVLVDRLVHLGVPILADVGFGHVRGAPSIPLGTRAELDTDTRTITVLDPFPALLR